jgi:hypothetical protein
MADKAIIETATRVIRRLTMDPNPPLATDEMAIDVTAKIDLSVGPLKLDQSANPVSATLAEWQQAGLDPVYNKQQGQAIVSNYKQSVIDSRDAWIAVRDNTGLPVPLRTAAGKQAQLIIAQANLEKATF